MATNYKQTALEQLGETGRHPLSRCSLCVIPSRKVARNKTRAPVYGAIAAFVQQRNCVTMDEVADALTGKAMKVNGELAASAYIRWALEDLAIAGYLGRHKVGRRVFFFPAFNGNAYEELGVRIREESAQ